MSPALFLCPIVSFLPCVLSNDAVRRPFLAPPSSFRSSSEKATPSFHDCLTPSLSLERLVLFYLLTSALFIREVISKEKFYL